MDLALKPVPTLFFSVSYSDIAGIGWQTFQNFGGNNNTGISDSTPDTNSTFGSDLNNVDYTLADGSAADRIGPFGGSGCSAWKFGNNNNEFFQGDFQGTNVSDYYFKLEKVHFDARRLRWL